MHETNPEMKHGSNRATWDPKNVFAGTSRFYTRYRPGYPKKVIQTILESFKLNDKSRVIDLGCGTGQIAIMLAPYIGEVIAIDPQEEMLQEGQKLDSVKRLSNITWVEGESADILSLVNKQEDIPLTIIARAFHWMDREQTLKDLYRLTKPGGGIAVVVDNGPLDGPELPWKRVIKETVKIWLGEERKAGTTGTYTHPTKSFEEFLEESEFENFKTVSIKSERTWSIDRIVGYVYSASYVSIPVLGDKKELFEADLRKRLTELNPTGRFRERVNTRIMMAWKKLTV